jgi:hypothetical protein
VSVVSIGCVVEGDGEVVSLPILIRRIAARVDPGLFVHVPRPVLVKRNKVGSQFGDLERGIELALRQVCASAQVQFRPPAAILVLFDADDEDPAVLAPDILQRLQARCRDIPSAVVMARREYEAWFLAAAESLRGHRGLPDDLTPPPDPERIRDAKGWLRGHMPGNRKYTETTDQPALTDRFDLDLARSRSHSFDDCFREIERLLRAMMAPPSSDPGGPGAAGSE